MFFREKKTGKQPILQLVESYRNARGKVSQRVVVSLAGCWVPDELRKLVAVELTHRAQGYQRILEEDYDAISFRHDSRPGRETGCRRSLRKKPAK